MLAALLHHLGQFQKVIAVNPLRLAKNPQTGGKAVVQDVSSSSMVTKRFSDPVDI